MFIFFFFLALVPTAFGKLNDNSFFLEEAYNQDKDEYQLTQKYFDNNYSAELEIPISDNNKHQVSVQGQNQDDSVLNYRLQTINGKGKLLAHRFGLLLLTEDGNYGIELMQAFTNNFSGSWANHWNLGASVKEEQQGVDVRGGTSLVYSLGPKLDTLFEVFMENKDKEFELFLSPGVRGIISINSGEIPVLVPGLAFPVSFQDGVTEVGVFLYFSMETI